MIAVSEAFVLGEKLGLSHQALFDVASTSSGQCWSLTTYCPVPGPVPTSPANRDYQPGFAAALMLKDLKLSQQAADQAGAATRLGAEAAALYAAFEAEGNAGRELLRHHRVDPRPHGVRGRPQSSSGPSPLPIPPPQAGEGACCANGSECSKSWWESPLPLAGEGWEGAFPKGKERTLDITKRALSTSGACGVERRDLFSGQRQMDGADEPFHLRGARCAGDGRGHAGPGDEPGQCHLAGAAPFAAAPHRAPRGCAGRAGSGSSPSCRRARFCRNRLPSGTCLSGNRRRGRRRE